MSEKMVKQLNLKPIARMMSYATAGVDPRIMGIGPVAAIPKALKIAGKKLDDIDVIELTKLSRPNRLRSCVNLESTGRN